MSFLVGLLAARGVSALLGTLLLATRSGPGFASPTLVVRHDTIWLETALVRGFDKPLLQVVQSGSVVALGYTVTVTGRGADNRVTSQDTIGFYHSTAYDPRQRSYSVTFSERGPGGTRDGLEQRPALDSLARVRLPLGARADFARAHQVSARIEAALNTIELDAMAGEELDLNAFWHYRYPRAATPWLRLEPR